MTHIAQLSPIFLSFFPEVTDIFIVYQNNVCLYFYYVCVYSEPIFKFLLLKHINLITIYQFLHIIPFKIVLPVNTCRSNLFIFHCIRIPLYEQSTIYFPLSCLPYFFHSSYTLRALWYKNVWALINDFSFKPLRLGLFCWAAIVLIPSVENNRVSLLNP